MMNYSYLKSRSLRLFLTENNIIKNSISCIWKCSINDIQVKYVKKNNLVIILSFPEDRYYLFEINQNRVYYLISYYCTTIYVTGTTVDITDDEIKGIRHTELFIQRLLDSKFYL